jgi:15,16-dihydrobiliverdin:ferredoxin oxidoreductase
MLFSLSLLSLFNALRFLTNSKFQFNTDDYLFHETSKLHLHYFEKYNFTEDLTLLYYETKTSPIQNATLQNFCFSNNQFRKVRLSYFKSNDKQMFNSVWYPSYHYDCPILTIDLAKFNSNTSLCFTNFVEMYKRNEYFDNFIEPFLEIKKLYPELSERKSVHLSHFDKYLSKAMLYGHIYDYNEYNTTVISALKRYFKLYFKKFIRKPIDRVHLYQTQEDYNKFRSTEDLKFFTKDYFDEEWFLHMTNALYK